MKNMIKSCVEAFKTAFVYPFCKEEGLGRIAKIEEYHNNGDLLRRVVTDKAGIRKIYTSAADKSSWEVYFLNKEGKPIITYNKTNYIKSEPFQTIITYKEGVGHFETYNFDYKKIQEGTLIRCQKEGVWKEWNSKGILYTEKTYKNNQLNGLCTVYHSNGKIKKQGNYENNQKEGVWKEWNADGSLSCYDTYRGGQLNGLCKVYFREEVTEGEYVNGQKEGVWKTTNEGKFVSSATYKHGKLDGFYSHYYYNGNLEEGHYVNGCREGVWTTSRSGKVISSQTYQKGILHGEANYSAYDKSLTKGEYVDGQKEGVWETTKNGKVSLETYQKGKLNGEYRFYAYDDSLIEGEYVNDKKEGVWKTTHKNKRVSYATYEQDCLTGYYFSYKNNRKPEQKGIYVNGCREGVWKEWDDNNRLYVRVYENGSLVTGREDEEPFRFYTAYLVRQLRQAKKRKQARKLLVDFHQQHPGHASALIKIKTAHTR